MVVANGQAFERVASIILARSLGVSDDLGAILAGYMTTRPVLEVIATLSELPDFRLEPAATKDWLRLARRAWEARNEAIHSPWVAVAENGEHTVGLNATVSRRNKVTRGDPSKLVDTMNLLSQATHDGAVLAGVLVDLSAGDPAEDTTD
jgi:hypothetical protein